MYALLLQLHSALVYALLLLPHLRGHMLTLRLDCARVWPHRKVVELPDMQVVYPVQFITIPRNDVRFLQPFISTTIMSNHAGWCAVCHSLVKVATLRQHAGHAQQHLDKNMEDCLHAGPMRRLLPRMVS